jgi:hypothetical protein
MLIRADFTEDTCLRVQTDGMLPISINLREALL